MYYVRFGMKKTRSVAKTKTFPLPVIIYEYGSYIPCTTQCSMPHRLIFIARFYDTKYYKYALGTGHVLFGQEGIATKRIEMNISL